MNTPIFLLPYLCHQKGAVFHVSLFVTNVIIEEYPLDGNYNKMDETALNCHSVYCILIKF